MSVSFEDRYALYVAWCKNMGIPPAPFAQWKHTTFQITEHRDEGAAERFGVLARPRA